MEEEWLLQAESRMHELEELVSDPDNVPEDWRQTALIACINKMRRLLNLARKEP